MNPFYFAIIAINVLSLIYVILVDCVYLVQLISSSLSLSKYVKSRHYSDHERYVDSENMIPISLLVPAYNEEATIIDNVKNLLALNFPEYELIIINDGSKDKTLPLLIQTFKLFAVNQPFKRSLQTKEVNAIYRSPDHPNLVIIDKRNGGKADALNAGINVSRYPVFVSIDADSILEKESLIKIIMPFVKDHRVVGVGGIVRIASGCKIVDGELKTIDLSRKAIVNLQTVEYLRSFLTGRIGFDAMGMLLIVSGAFGAFNKQTAIEAGGYSNDCIGEDMELVIKMHRMLRERKTKYRIKFIPDPVCWTQPPETVKDLRKQRRRWQIGLMFSLFKHKKMLLNPKYGRIGMASLPYYWLFEFVGPVFELLGYIAVPISYAMGIINVNFFLGFFAVAVLYGIVLSIGALLLEENTFKKYPSFRQLLKLTFYAIIDNFGYRQINTIFRVEALFAYRKQKNSWGSMQRKTFTGDKSSPTTAQLYGNYRTSAFRPLKRTLIGLNAKQVDAYRLTLYGYILKSQKAYEQRLHEVVEENLRLATEFKEINARYVDSADATMSERTNAREMEHRLQELRQSSQRMEQHHLDLLRSSVYEEDNRHLDLLQQRLFNLEQASLLTDRASVESPENNMPDKSTFVFPDGLDAVDLKASDARALMRRLYSFRSGDTKT